MEREDIIKQLKSRNILHLSRDDQHCYALKTFEMTYKCVECIINGSISHDYRNDAVDGHNPLLWSFGHILYFWERFFCMFVYPRDPYPILKRADDLYLSFMDADNKYISRFNHQVHTVDELTRYADQIWIYIEKWILHSKTQRHHENYAFMTCLLHSHIHIECFLVDFQMFRMSNPLLESTRLRLPANRNHLKLEMTLIPGGKYMQGSHNNGNCMVWDNELSRFNTVIKDFSISKYPITQGQYLDFVKTGEYTNKKYWSKSGKIWLKKTHSRSPVFWKLENGCWYRLHFGKWVILEFDYPMIHVNYYEAEAYCKWVNGRLITETEWEYIATQGGRFNDIDDERCNLGYSIGDIRSVRDESISEWGVSEMIGNVWCWCKDRFYPYPDYNIEPLYRELSYPDFGHTYILRGGSWAVPDVFISKFYRKFQLPHVRKQFTGFRLVCELDNI